MGTSSGRCGNQRSTPPLFQRDFTFGLPFISFRLSGLRLCPLLDRGIDDTALRDAAPRRSVRVYRRKRGKRDKNLVLVVDQTRKKK